MDATELYTAESPTQKLRKAPDSFCPVLSAFGKERIAKPWNKTVKQKSYQLLYIPPCHVSLFILFSIALSARPGFHFIIKIVASRASIDRLDADFLSFMIRKLTGFVNDPVRKIGCARCTTWENVFCAVQRISVLLLLILCVEHNIVKYKTEQKMNV